jgi:predicted solute-binding protein
VESDLAVDAEVLSVLMDKVSVSSDEASVTETAEALTAVALTRLLMILQLGAPQKELEKRAPSAPFAS